MSRIVLLRDLPQSARRSLVPGAAADARGLVMFDVHPRVARRFNAAINADGIVVLMRAPQTNGGAPC